MHDNRSKSISNSNFPNKFQTQTNTALTNHMTSQSIKTTKTESKTPRNRSHQNQNLRTTHHSKSPTSSEILTISFWGEAKRNRN